MKIQLQWKPTLDGSCWLLWHEDYRVGAIHFLIDHWLGALPVIDHNGRCGFLTVKGTQKKCANFVVEAALKQIKEETI